MGSPLTPPAKPAQPIMDVAPPAKAPVAPAPPTLAEPPAEPHESLAEAVKLPEQKAAATPKPAKTSQAPVLAIALAIIFFVVLASLAFYAYAKAK